MNFQGFPATTIFAYLTIHLTGINSHLPSAWEEKQDSVQKSCLKKHVTTAPFNKKIYLKYTALENTWQKFET